MKILFIDIALFPLSLPSSFFWHNIGKSFAHSFQIVGDFPPLLLQVANRIKNTVENLFKSSSIISNDSSPIYLSKSAFPHLIVEVAQLSSDQVALQRKGIFPIKQVINVPDDGNCLFYAVAVGLRKKLPESLPQWHISIERLKEDLSKGYKLLKEPAATLRQEAATYLHHHIQEDEIILTLIEGIYSHQEIVRKKIKEEEEALSFLQTDILNLRKITETEDILKQLDQKLMQLQITQNSIKLQQEHLPSIDNLQAYIMMTEEDHVYCGTPQLYALSKQYDIPIKILYKFEQSDQFEQIFNASSQKPILTIAHVDGNHFKYIDS